MSQSPDPTSSDHSRTVQLHGCCPGGWRQRQQLASVAQTVCRATPIMRPGCDYRTIAGREQSSSQATEASRDGTRQFKKSHGLLCEPKPVRYHWIKEHTTMWPIKTMCNALKVSTSGFYDFRGRKPSVRSKRSDQIKRDVQQVHDEHHGIYNSCPRKRLPTSCNNAMTWNRLAATPLPRPCEN